MDENNRRSSLLLVDDLLENIEILAEIFKADYQVRFALNGNKALAIARSAEPPDLILLDVCMPDMDGYEVCRQLKGNPDTAAIPVIFVTALNEPVEEARAFEVGAVDFISKPVHPLVARARVKTHVALKHAMVELARQNSVLRENVRLREDVDRITRHDLKSPLTGFVNAPEVLRLSGPLNDEQNLIAEHLRKSAWRMIEMINRSLDLVKMETGRYQLQAAAIDLIKTVRQVALELDELLRFKKLRLDLTVGGKPATGDTEVAILGEEMLVFSLLGNLLKNAFEAAPTEAVVTVAVRDLGAQIEVAIHNPGAIPASIRGRFFEKYQTEGKVGGTGLGAYSARLMTQTLNGAISFASSDEAGTTLMVVLPKPTVAGT